MRRFLFILLSYLLLPGLAAAASITGVSVVPGANGAEQVVFTTDAPITPLKRFTLDNPHRVVVDIPHARATGVMLPRDYAGSLISNVRFGQFDMNISRLVIDVRAPSRIVQAGPQGANRLVIEMAPLAPVPPAVNVPKNAPVPAAPTKSSPFEPIDNPAPVPEKLKPLIVLDAGHGGQDPGALGQSSREKHVVLGITKAVKQALLRTGRYRVLMTREDDTYVPLQGRVDIARKAKADIFISLHADSNPRKEARGLSVYTLSETASDDEAAALAEQENKSDIIAGIDLDTADADVASILIDLTQRETMNKSALLADTVVATLHPRITKLPSTHRFAGFRVLKAPDIPSVLIETGFISNSTDERLLDTAEYRDQLGQSVVKAVDTYMAKK